MEVCQESQLMDSESYRSRENSPIQPSNSVSDGNSIEVSENGSENCASLNSSENCTESGHCLTFDSIPETEKGEKAADVENSKFSIRGTDAVNCSSLSQYQQYLVEINGLERINDSDKLSTALDELRQEDNNIMNMKVDMVDYGDSSEEKLCQENKNSTNKSQNSFINGSSSVLCLEKVKIVRNNEVEDNTATLFEDNEENTYSESRNDFSKTSPNVPQLFEDITEDEDEEILENIDLELDDEAKPTKFTKSNTQNCDNHSLAIEIDLKKLENVSSKLLNTLQNAGNVQPVEEEFKSTLKTDEQNVCDSVVIKTTADKESAYLEQASSTSPLISKNHSISRKKEKQVKAGMILSNTNIFKAVATATSENYLCPKQKSTARKTGKPVNKKDCLTLKTIDLHPIKNIKMKVSEIEGALDLGPSQDDESEMKKTSENSTCNKDATLKRALVTSELDVENSASNDLTCPKKRKTKITSDLSGHKKKLKAKSEDLKSIVSLTKFPGFTSYKNSVPNKNLIITANKSGILTENSHLSRKKKQHSSGGSPPSLFTKSSSSSVSSVGLCMQSSGKNNKKMKSVLDMLLEKNKQKGDIEETKTGCNISKVVSVTTNATSTTTTVLVLPPPNKPIVEGFKRRGAQKKHKGKRDSSGNNSTLLPSAFSTPHSLPTKKNTAVPKPPLVMMVAQHSSVPGLRSLLPRNSAASSTNSSTKKIVNKPSPGSKLGQFPLFSTLPVGAKAVSMANLPPGVTLIPSTSLPSSFFTTIPASIATVVPIAFPASNIAGVISNKQHNNTSSDNNIETTTSNTLSEMEKIKNTSSATSISGSPETLGALSIGTCPATMTLAVSTPSHLTSSPVVNQMITTSVTSLVSVPTQQMTTSSAQAVLKLSSSSMLVSKSSSSSLKTHPPLVSDGISCLTSPKIPDTDTSPEVHGSASLTQSLADQESEAEIIPLCCCKINGTSVNKMSAGVTYCQALDTVDSKVLGCCNKVTNSHLVRPGVKIPFMAVCEAHRKRLKLHQCCPGCGHFCTQGKFQECRKEGKSSVHNFHKQCMVFHGGKYHCPHCGEETSQCEVQLNEETGDEAKLLKNRQAKTETERKTSRISSKNFVKSRSTNEPKIKTIILPGNKIINLDALPLGPENQMLTKLCRCATEDRPKKYRTLPKDLYTPAYEGDLEKVFFLLVDGVDPNMRNEANEGQTAMHAAAISGSIGTVFILQQFGAEIHAQDKTLRTPLMCAAENGNLRIVQFLIKAGAKVEDRGEDGMTSLHYAAKAGFIDIIQHILQTKKLDINIQDDGGWTPIIWATESQLPDVVKHLLEHGGDPNKKDNEENTGLHWASFSGSLKIAEMFLDIGCEIDAVNEHGDRPLHIAARQDHYDIVVLLLARGADVDTKNNKDETPVESCVNKNGQVWMALKVNQQLRSFATRKLIHPERHLERDITMGREKNPIACVNSEDNQLCPKDYMYINKNVVTSPLSINNIITSLRSCQCRDNCSSLLCECARGSIKCWYDKAGRLLDEVNLNEPPLVFECNRACRCWASCKNRVVQNGIICQLQIFKTSTKGWGVRTLIDIPKGTFVCEYIGELIAGSEADRRADDSYIYDLGSEGNESYCIDTRKYGNISRFINHLCEPNLVPVKVFVENQDLCFPRICLFSCRDIKTYEEIGFDYGERFWMVKSQQFACACKSDKCRYSTDIISKTQENSKILSPHENMNVL